MMSPDVSHTVVPESGYFSRISPRDSGAMQRIAMQTLGGQGYRLHKKLWELFASPDVERRDFLYRRIDEDGGEQPEVVGPSFYMLSRRPPSQESDLWRVECKPYAPRLHTGDRLTFSLRANPVVARSPAPGSRSTRHDAVMDAKKHSSQPCTAALVQEACAAWLSARAERHGFKVVAVCADGYRQHRLSKGRGTPIRFSTVDFAGALRVTDVAAFQRAIFTGIGPAKGFGCGLLLLRR